jgi:hypothetical protein
MTAAQYRLAAPTYNRLLRVSMSRDWLWCFVALVACQHAHPAATDAASAADAAEIADAPPPNVHVVVTTQLGDGKPDPTAIAIFVDGSGAVVGEGTVDASGTASSYLAAAGGAVTVVQQETGSDGTVREQLTTIRDIAPGESLAVGAARDATMLVGETEPMTASYMLDSAAPQIEEVLLACGGGETDGNGLTGTLNLVFYVSCVTPTFSMLTIAIGSGGREYAWQTGVPFSDQGTFSVPDTWQPYATSTLSLASSVTGELLTAERFVRIDGTPVMLSEQGLQSTGSGDAFSLSYAPNAGTGSTTSVITSNGLQPIERRAIVRPDEPGDQTLDMSALPVPTVTGTAVQSSTSVSWTPVYAGNPDLRIVRWNGSFGNHEAKWRIVEAADAAPSCALPGLPAEYAALDPTAAPGVTLIGADVLYLDYDNLDGYAAAHVLGPQLEDVENALPDVPHTAHISYSFVPPGH